MIKLLQIIGIIIIIDSYIFSFKERDYNHK